MRINSRVFGEVEIDQNKIIEFVNGIVGFPELTEFALISNNEESTDAPIKWLQSMQDGEVALPVIDPLLILPDYNPQVEDEWLKSLGELSAENLLVLVTVTVPKDITGMSINLKGPIIIQVDQKKACQVIVDGEEYALKYPIYELLKSRKEGE